MRSEDDSTRMTPRQNRPRVLVVDDQSEMAETLAEGLSDYGYDAAPCSSSRDGAHRLESESFDALVTDLRMPHVDGFGLLDLSRKIAPERPVIVMTAFGAIESAVNAIRQGAFHYLTKPFSVSELAIFLERALDVAGVRREARSLRATLRETVGFGNLVAESAGMKDVLDMARRLADASTPVLIAGETGTGKTALARAIHAASTRAAKPFVTVNCAALPEALLESELFGHVRGAFTGAATNRTGLFEEAHGGTLLLDEIGEMSAGLQAKLLHVLESGSIRAVGASKERAIDVRVLAATHRNLRARVQTGEFREDLLYRLDVVRIEIPALRHRREDILPLLAKLLVQAKAKHSHSPVETIAPDAMATLLDYAWPGNVRELAHVIERVVLLGVAAHVHTSDLPPSVLAAPPAGLPEILTDEVLPIREVQRRYASWVLERFGGQKGRTADALGVDGKTLAKWLGAD
jgi:two-component system, NtrC family, response regulator HydG